MYSKPIKVVYMFYCSFFSKPVSPFPVMASQQPLTLSFCVGLFFTSLHKQCTSAFFLFFFFPPQAAAIEAAAYIWKTRKMHTFLHKLFCSVCVAVVHSLLFISKLGSRVCCVRVTSPLQGKSKDCT